MPTRFSMLSREVQIAILVTLTHVVAGYLLLRGAGPSFSAVPQAPVWAMTAEMVSDAVPEQVQVEATRAAAEVAEPTSSSAPQKPPAELPATPVASLPAIPKNEVPPAMAAVSIEPQGSVGMLKVMPIALPDSPPVAFVPPPSMVGGALAPSPSPCLDHNRVQRRGNQPDAESSCAD